MTPQDMDRVWSLLGYCRLDDPHLKDKALKAAWFLVLEPYAYNDVKQAVAAHFRVKRFWPEIGEITQYLPPVPTPPALREKAKRTGGMGREVAALRKALERPPRPSPSPSLTQPPRPERPLSVDNTVSMPTMPGNTGPFANGKPTTSTF